MMLRVSNRLYFGKEKAISVFQALNAIWYLENFVERVYAQLCSHIDIK